MLLRNQNCALINVHQCHQNPVRETRSGHVSGPFRAQIGLSVLTLVWVPVPALVHVGTLYLVRTALNCCSVASVRTPVGSKWVRPTLKPASVRYCRNLFNLWAAKRHGAETFGQVRFQGKLYVLPTQKHGGGSIILGSFFFNQTELWLQVDEVLNSSQCSLNSSGNFLYEV